MNTCKSHTQALHAPTQVNSADLDSIAVPLFTNSETAAATPLRVMRNFQRTFNQ